MYFIIFYHYLSLFYFISCIIINNFVCVPTYVKHYSYQLSKQNVRIHRVTHGLQDTHLVLLSRYLWVAGNIKMCVWSHDIMHVSMYI